MTLDIKTPWEVHCRWVRETKAPQFLMQPKALQCTL